MAELGGSALFAARFRENAARALLLPRRRPGQRTPLWQLRQRVGRPAGRGQPVRLVPDPARDVSRGPARRVRPAGAASSCCAASARATSGSSSVETRSASPFARSLMFDYIGAFMYEGDAPLAERRAQALALDRERLRELLGPEELRELLDPEAVAGAGARAAVADRSPPRAHPRRCGRPAAPPRRPPNRRGRGAHDRWPRRRRGARELEGARRAVRVRIAGEERWIAVEDVARYRDALGASPPRGVPETCLAATDAPAGRAARALGAHPRARSPPRAGRRAGASARALRGGAAAARSSAPGRCSRASSGPAARLTSGSDPDVLRRCAVARWRACGARSSRCEPAALGRFLPAWHGVGATAGWTARLLEVVAQLEGVPSRRRSSSATSCRPRRAATRRACWTSCAPAAKWCGSVAARSGATTDASRCTVASAWRCWRRRCADDRPTSRSTSASASICSARRVVLPRSFARGGRTRGRARGAGRAVGSGVVGRGHQ